MKYFQIVDKQEMQDQDQSEYGFLIYFGSVAVNVKTEVQPIFRQKTQNFHEILFL